MKAMDAVCKALECAEAALEALLKDDQGLAVGLCFVLPALAYWQQRRVNTRVSSEVTVSSLVIYPIKACSGLSLTQADVDDLGLAWDRRFMIVDAKTRNFISQRQYPHMALLHVHVRNDGRLVLSSDGQDDLLLSQQTPGIVLAPGQEYAGTSAVVGKLPPQGSGARVETTLWEKRVVAEHISDEHDAWVSKAIGRKVKLVRTLPRGEHSRPVKRSKQYPDTDTGFPDGFPFLLASTASLYDLNLRLASPVDMRRFRPNIIVTGCLPWEEDSWGDIDINHMRFASPKACIRCTVPNVDPDAGKRDRLQEPSATMEGFRRLGSNLYFGQNLVQYSKSGTIHVHDPVTVRQRKCEPVALLSA